VTSNQTEADALALVQQHRGQEPVPSDAARVGHHRAGGLRRATPLRGLAATRCRRVVGYKIGSRRRACRRCAAFAEPICGAVLATRVHTSGVVLRAQRVRPLGLGRDRGAHRQHVPGADQTAGSVRRYADAVCAQSRSSSDREPLRQLDVRGLVADNSWNAGVVLSGW